MIFIAAIIIFLIYSYILVPDFNTVFPLLAQVMKNLKPPNKNQTFRFFLSADKEAKRDATFFMKVGEDAKLKGV